MLVAWRGAVEASRSACLPQHSNVTLRTVYSGPMMIETADIDDAIAVLIAIRDAK